MIDNFEVIKKLLEFPNSDNFYFVQVLQRKKDHPGVRLGGSNNNSRVIKTYRIQSKEHLDIHKEEMIKLAEVYNARVGINLNPRSFEKAAFQVMVKIANQMENKNFKDVAKAYDSICGNYHSEMDKRWLIDIDTKDENVVAAIKAAVLVCQSKILNRDYKILAEIETRSGFHLITNPFNMEEFSKLAPTIEVHKNNPTLLYCI